MTACIHCGTEFSPSHEGENFCCKGCEFVHALIREEGLERFYDLQDGVVGQPVRDRPFRPADLAWLDCELRADCSGSPVAVLEISVSDTGARIDTIKASLRAGVAVGKSVAHTTGLVAGSLALAAHHGAMALATAALGVF